MDVTKKNLEQAAAENIISNQQAEALYDYLANRSQDVPKFTFTLSLIHI